MSQKKLTWIQIIGYGSGHVFNDICASMWFTYLLLFFQEVMNFESISSGQLLLVGQIADGISTLIVGMLADRLSYVFICRKYGGEKTWHLLGTICVAVSFPFIFLPCQGCSSSSLAVKMVYYSAFIILFQFGWACVQISHLALITKLTDRPSTRTTLTSVRYGATVGSNIFVYFVTWMFFGLEATNERVNPGDQDKFRNIMLCGVGVGLVSSVIFHILIKEEVKKKKEDKVSTTTTFRNYAQFFKKPYIYMVSFIYIGTRLFVNVSQSYITLYLQETLDLPSTYVATIPLTMFIAGFVASFIVKPLHRYIGESQSWILAAGVGCGTVIWLYIDASDFYLKYGVYGVAILYGAANSIFLITSLALTADLIGSQVSSAAFIYGFMSLLEKVVNGLAVLVIQSMVPCEKTPSLTTLPNMDGGSTTESVDLLATPTTGCSGYLGRSAPSHECNSTVNIIDVTEACSEFYRTVLFYVNGGSAILGALVCCILIIAKFYSNRSEKEQKLNSSTAIVSKEPDESAIHI